MNFKNYTDVLIDGKIYTLGGFEEESYLQRVASYLNEKISNLRKQDGFGRQNIDYQMLMIELNMADDYFKALDRATTLERQKLETEKEVYSLKHELVSTQMKLEAARKEEKSLKEKLKQSSEETKKLKGEAKDAQSSQTAEAGLKILGKNQQQ